MHNSFVPLSRGELLLHLPSTLPLTEFLWIDTEPGRLASTRGEITEQRSQASSKRRHSMQNVEKAYSIRRVRSTTRNTAVTVQTKHETRGSRQEEEQAKHPKTKTTIVTSQKYSYRLFLHSTVLCSQKPARGDTKHSGDVDKNDDIRREHRKFRVRSPL